jgi:glucokinase
MILAGDIGGTKTLLGLFDPVPARPRAISIGAFATLDHRDLPSIISKFLSGDDARRAGVTAACFGVAGPVVGDAAELTNVPWRVDAFTVSTTFGIPRVKLLNDLEAMAYGVPALHEAEVHTLQEGVALRGGNIAVIAAGTGLGEALLHSVAGRFIPSASEGGHADFAARTDGEVDVMRYLTARFGRAEVEQVVSGMGIINLHHVAHPKGCAIVTDVSDPRAAAEITSAALERRCEGCMRTLDMFVEAYGAEGGNLALRAVATGGVYIGGGIAPKILPALTDGRFMRVFRAKAPFEEMLSKIPVKVIVNPEVGLLGAAVYAASL